MHICSSGVEIGFASFWSRISLINYCVFSCKKSRDQEIKWQLYFGFVSVKENANGRPQPLLQEPHYGSRPQPYSEFVLLLFAFSHSQFSFVFPPYLLPGKIFARYFPTKQRQRAQHNARSLSFCQVRDVIAAVNFSMMKICGTFAHDRVLWVVLEIGSKRMRIDYEKNVYAVREAWKDNSERILPAINAIPERNGRKVGFKKRFNFLTWIPKHIKDESYGN